MATKKAKSSPKAKSSSKSKPAEVAKAPAKDAALPETTSGGGPVVLVPAEHAASWRGTSAPKGAKVPAGWTWGKSGGPTTDYDRALEPNDLKETARGSLGWLDVAGGQALILGDEQTTVWLPTDDGGVVVRGPDVSAADPVAVRASVPASGWKHYLDGLTLKDGRVFLFDSAFPGAPKPEQIKADDGVAVGKPGPGTYTVSFAQSGTTDFIRLSRGGKASAKAAKPKPAPAKKAAAPASDGPAWKTRRVAHAALPKTPNLDGKTGLSLSRQGPGGVILGRERGAPAKARYVRVAADGTRTFISQPGELMYADFSADGRTILAATLDQKLIDFPAGGDTTQATPRLTCKARVWSIQPLSPTRAVVAVDAEVMLIGLDGTWRVLDGVRVAPIQVPMIDVLGGGRWVLVGRDPKIHLFAIVGDMLRLVQTWVQTQGGMVARDGRPFLYAKGQLDMDEVLNLDEVYPTIA
ncbi:MAG: Imm21 family immunity protein [Myxococcota bacterium]